MQALSSTLNAVTPTTPTTPTAQVSGNKRGETAIRRRVSERGDDVDMAMMDWLRKQIILWLVHVCHNNYLQVQIRTKGLGRRVTVKSEKEAIKPQTRKHYVCSFQVLSRSLSASVTTC